MTGVVLLSLPVQSQAFGYEGHALVCGLAYEALTEATRKNVDHLTAQSGLGQTFPYLCSWADDTRSEEQWKYTGPWHYVNVERGDTEIHRSHCPDKGCVLSAIETMEARLQKAPETDWQALLFLGHFVADVHQPLHVSYGDDRGGNTFRLFWDGEPTNLHAIWDRQITGLSPAVNVNLRDFQPQMNSYEMGHTQADELVWAQESLDKTRQIYQTYRPGDHLQDGDVGEDRMWLQEHMIEAAKRLADRLEALL